MLFIKNFEVWNLDFAPGLRRYCFGRALGPDDLPGLVPGLLHRFLPSATCFVALAGMQLIPDELPTDPL